MAKVKKPKKLKKLYDENGNWIEERGRIKGALRKTFRLSPQHKETLQDARIELPPKLKKNGQPGKVNQVRYKCAMCQELFQQKFVQVDHIETVVPLWKAETDMHYDGPDGLIRRIICKKDNLQVLCSTPLKFSDGKSSCHKIKTDKEKFFRSKFKEVIEKKLLTSNLNIDKTTEGWCNEYEEFLKAKEEKALAKVERKRLRELKKTNK